MDSLGPRFVDWWWHTPLPVDADLLPEVVPGFKTPFRQCPPGVRPTLEDEELTYVRKLARPLPTHFALGTLHGRGGPPTTMNTCDLTPEPDELDNDNIVNLDLDDTVDP
ncbi:Chloroplastic group IIA intron splicing facilitator CRS1, chloroplastic [Hordeum vulgare]|nr:Chloroplastic group IIA intron splicing facilitator CRS1, chloroplastic [Hordeum vulgare]